MSMPVRKPPAPIRKGCQVVMPGAPEKEGSAAADKAKSAMTIVARHHAYGFIGRTSIHLERVKRRRAIMPVKVMQIWGGRMVP